MSDTAEKNYEALSTAELVKELDEASNHMSKWHYPYCEAIYEAIRRLKQHDEERAAKYPVPASRS